MIMMIFNDKILARDLEPIPMDGDEMDKAEALTIQVFFLLGAALISIGGRLYVRCRRLGVKNLGLEDGLAVAGMVGIISCCSLHQSIYIHGRY